MLGHSRLQKLVREGAVIGALPERVNPASIDITLHHVVMVEDTLPSIVDLLDKRTVKFHELDFKNGYFDLAPGQFILAASAEIFNLPPSIAAEYKLKSSLARNGLAHLLAGHCDPSWHGSRLTLELYNATQHAVLRLRPGMPIGQMIFHDVDGVIPEEASYANRGQYNNDAGPTVRGVR